MSNVKPASSVSQAHFLKFDLLYTLFHVRNIIILRMYLFNTCNINFFSAMRNKHNTNKLSAFTFIIKNFDLSCIIIDRKLSKTPETMKLQDSMTVSTNVLKNNLCRMFASF